MKLKKVFIVGSFPKKNRIIFGGILKSCSYIIKSEFFNFFDIYKFDSSQITNPPPTFIIRLFLSLKRLLSFFIKIPIQKPNVVLVFCSDGWSAIEKGVMLLYCKVFDIKTVIFPRAGNLIIQTKESKTFHALISFLFNYADLFLCQGLNWDIYARDVIKMGSEKIKTINNWTATSELLEIGRERIVKKDFLKVKILFVGWVEKDKGILDLLNVINSLVNKGHPIFLDVVGDGSLKYFILDFLKKNRLESNVKIVGWKNSLELNEFFKNSDIFVLPSHKEGMPNALIEAMASGLPSITTSVGLIPNHIKNEIDALIVNPKNIIELELAIEKLIKDFNLRLFLSNNAIKTSEEKFGKNQLQNLSNVINDLI